MTSSTDRPQGWSRRLATFAAGLIAGIAIVWASSRSATPQAAQRRAPALRVDAFSRVAREAERSVVFLHTMSGVPSPTAPALFAPEPLLRPGLIQPIEDGLGSGVVIDAGGLILTNAHVIEGASVIHVRTMNGDDVDATVVGADPETDLAVLRPAQSTDLRPAPLGDSTKLRVGDWVVAIGNPLGLHHTVTAGIISAKARGLDESGLEFLQTDATINPGSSGGPLLDLNGAVVGLTTAILSTSARGGSIGLNFAIPVETIKDTLPGLRAGSVVHGWIGVATRGLSRSGARALGLDPPEGLVVIDVVVDGPVARAGVQAGDVILGIAEQPFIPARDVQRRLLRAQPGVTLPLRIWRQGTRLDVHVVVGVRPR